MTTGLPPPLPPKGDSPINNNSQPLIDETSSKKVLLSPSVATSTNTKLPRHSTSPVEVSPRIGITGRPPLSSRILCEPPPLPPRCSKPLIALRKAERKSTEVASITNNFTALNDLLSPISLTESEIGLAKYNLRLEDSKDDDGEHSPPVPPKSAAIRAAKNYYNHMAVTGGNAKKNGNMASNEPSSGSKQATGAKGSSSSPNQGKGAMAEAEVERSNSRTGGVDVYTQTERDKLKQQQKMSTGVARPSSALSMSSYYMDPVDALKMNQQHLQVTGTESIVSSKRHSDPELASSTLSTIDLHRNARQRGTGGGDYSLSSYNWYTMGKHSLESLLVAFRQKFPNQPADSSETYEAREVALKMAHKRTGDEQLTSVVSTWQWRGGYQGPGPIEPPSIARVQQQSQQQRPSSRNANATTSVAAAAASTPLMGNAFQQIVNAVVNGPESVQPVNKRTAMVGGTPGGGAQHFNQTIKSTVTTVEDRINAQAPELVVPKMAHVSNVNNSNCNKDVDTAAAHSSNNFENSSALKFNHRHQSSNDTTTTTTGNTSQSGAETNAGTEFCEPWQTIDALESMLLNDFGPTSLNVSSLDEAGGEPLSCQLLKNEMIHFNSYLLRPEEDEDDLDDYDNVAGDEEAEDEEEGSVDEGIVAPQVPPRARKPNGSSQATNNNRAQAANNSEVVVMLSIVENISSYICDLAAPGKDNTFAKSIANFIECTKESTESNPTV